MVRMRRDDTAHRKCGGRTTKAFGSAHGMHGSAWDRAATGRWATSFSEHLLGTQVDSIAVDIRVCHSAARLYRSDHIEKAR